MSSDPVTAYLSAYGPPERQPRREPENPVSAYLREYGRSDQERQGAASDFAEQGARGLAEAGYATATGLSKLADYLPGVDTKRATGALDRSRQEMREYYGDADTGAGTAGHVIGRVLGEGATLATGGGLARGATAIGGRFLSRLGASKAGKLATRAASAGSTRKGRFARDAAFGAPGDVAIASAGYDDSAAGGLAEVLESETLERVARNPAGRALFEVGLGTLGAGAIHGAGAGLEAAGRAIDPVGDAVTEGVRTFSRQARGEYGGDFKPQQRMGLGPGATVRHAGNNMRINVERVEGGVIYGKDSLGGDVRIPVERVNIEEEVPILGPDPRQRETGAPVSPDGAAEETAQAHATAETTPEPGTGRPGRLPRPDDPLEEPAFTRRGPDRTDEINQARLDTDTRERLSRRPPRRGPLAGLRGDASPLEELSDEEITRRYLNRIRTATIEEVRSSGRSVNAMGRRRQAVEATDELAAEMQRRGIPEPDPDQAFTGAGPDDFPATTRYDVEEVQNELGDLSVMDDEALEGALRQAEESAARSTDLKDHLRRALLAGELAGRTGAPLGFADRQLLESIAGAGIGGAAGVALSPDNPYRGAVLGAVAGGASPRIVRGEIADFAERGPMRAGSLGDQPGPTPRFYSRLTRALDRFPNEAAAPGEIRTYLKKQGVKDAEIDWVLGDLSEMATEVPVRRGRGATRQSVDIAALRQRAEERGVKVGEQTFTDTDTGPLTAAVRSAEQDVDEASNRLRRILEVGHGMDRTKIANIMADVSVSRRSPSAIIRDRGLPDDAEIRAGLERLRLASTEHTAAQDALSAGRAESPKYSKYTEPGGENYREVVLTLDGGTGSKSVSPEEHARYNELNAREVQAAEGSGQPLTQQEMDEWASLRERITADARQDGTYRSPHWKGVDNPVAHVRMADRTGPNGEKILHVEEIQSDWAQAGRKKGFRDDEVPRRDLRERKDGDEWVVEADGEELWRGKRFSGAMEFIGAERNREMSAAQAGVTDTPFRDTDDWLGLALRRVIDEAVEGGYDRIAWTPGAKQAKRYDLRNQVDHLLYKRNPDGTFRVSAQLPGGRPSQLLGESLSARELEDHVGKDVARRMTENAGEPTNIGGPGTTSQPRDIWNRLEGDDLEVGGEGMVAFYDEMVPQAIRRYARSQGVEIDVEPVDPILPHPNAVPAGRDAADLALPPSGFPSVRVPQRLKGKVRNEGQHLLTGLPPGAFRSGAGQAAAGAGAGGAVGGAVDDESPVRGALAGAAAGAGGVAAVRALRRAPKAAASNPKLAEALNDPMVKRVADSFGAGKQEPRFTDRIKGATTKHAAALAQWLRYKGFRDVLPLERFGKEVGGSDRLRNVAGQARGWLPAAHLHVEQALDPIRKAISGSDELSRAVRAYARAQRGLQLAKAGKETSPEQLNAWRATVRKLGEVEEVQAGAEAVSGYYRDLLRMKREAGLITQEQYDAILAEGDYYIPFIPDRVADRLRSGTGGGKYAPPKSAGLRRMSDELNEADIVDPIEQAVLDTYETFQRVAKQRVANVVSEIVEANPDAALPFLRQVEGERVGGMTFPPKAEDGRIVDAIVDGERRYYEITDDDLFNSWASFDQRLRSTMLDAANATRRVMQAGITGHPAFAVANGMRDFFVSGLQYGSAGIGRSAAAMGTGAAAGATVDGEDRLRGAALGAGVAGGGIFAKHWGEHIARNVAAMSDIIGPEITGATFGGIAGGMVGQEDDGGFLGWLSGVGAGAAVGAAGGRGFRALGRGGNRAIYDEYIREGGGQFGFYAKNRRDAKRLLQQLEKDGVSASDIINPRSWWDAIQHVSKAIETAPRLAKYKALKAAGEDTGEAIFQARDLSLDFSVKPGSKGLQVAAQTVPFFNPALQGMDKLVRLLSDPRTTATAAGTILAPTLALWAINKDDSAYWNRPLYERNTYWLVPKRLNGGPEGEFWRVPKPFEAGFIYSSLPERMMDYAYMRNPEQLKFSMLDAWGLYGPGNLAPVPVAGGPLMEATWGEHGHDTFRQRPVNPYPWKNVEPEEQFTDRTSSLAVGLGRLANISPAKIDHVLIGHTGSLGAQALDWLSGAARATGVDSRPEPAGSGIGPFARFSTRPEHITEPERAFRRQWQASDRAYQTLKTKAERAKVSGDPRDLADARRYAQEHLNELRAYDERKDLDQALGEVWDVRRAIYDNRELEPAEKRRLLGAINQQIGARLMEMQRGSGSLLPGGKEPAYAEPTRSTGRTPTNR